MSSAKTFLDLYEKFTKKNKLPIVNIIFVFDLFVLWKPQYTSLVSANSWVTKSIRSYIIKCVTIFNSYFIVFLITIILLFFAIILLCLWNPVLRLFPKNVEMSNETVIIWHPIIAFKRVLDLLLLTLSNIWIYWLTLNIILNPFDFTEEFYNLDNLNNKLVINHYITDNMLIVCYVLVFVNALITIFFLLKALFQNRVPTFNMRIESNELIVYTELNSFTYSKNGKYNKKMILKKNVEKKTFYYIASGEGKDISQNNYIDDYEILNQSENFAEIKYHFDTLKSEHEKDKVDV